MEDRRAVHSLVVRWGGNLGDRQAVHLSVENWVQHLEHPTRRERNLEIEMVNRILRSGSLMENPIFPPAMTMVGPMMVVLQYLARLRMETSLARLTNDLRVVLKAMTLALLTKSQTVVLLLSALVLLMPRRRVGMLVL